LVELIHSLKAYNWAWSDGPMQAKELKIKNHDIIFSSSMMHWIVNAIDQKFDSRV
jgi:hypothetical protein